MNDVERWPFDYDTLNKGDIIPAQRIEEVIHIRQDDARYQLKLMALVQQVERELHERGKMWTVKTEKGGIKVLTDSEAYIYNHRIQESDRRSMMRRYLLNEAIDTTKLEPDQLKEYERFQEIGGKYVQAFASVRKELRLQAHERSVPGLPSPSTPHKRDQKQDRHNQQKPESKRDVVSGQGHG